MMKSLREKAEEGKGVGNLQLSLREEQEVSLAKVNTVMVNSFPGIVFPALWAKLPYQHSSEWVSIPFLIGIFKMLLCNISELGFQKHPPTQESPHTQEQKKHLKSPPRSGSHLRLATRALNVARASTDVGQVSINWQLHVDWKGTKTIYEGGRDICNKEEISEFNFQGWLVQFQQGR